MGKLFLLDPKLDDLSRTRLIRIERVNVAVFSDEFWKAVKCQSDLVLAGILRNICKYEIYSKFMEVQHGNSKQFIIIIIMRLGCGDLVNLTNGI